MLTLEKRNGLYYCPTNVFTVAPDPTYPTAPTIIHIAAPSPPELPNVKRGRCYMPTSRSKLAESETWMLCLGLPGKSNWTSYLIT